MRLPIITTVAVLSSLSLVGCGGGGGGGTNASNNNFRWTTQEVFADGAGLARAVDTSTGQEILMLVPNVAAEVAAANQPGVASFDSSPFEIVATAPNVRFRQGTATSNGYTFNVLIAEDVGDEALAMYLYDNTSGALSVTGLPHGSTPSGSYTYTGAFFAGNRVSPGTFVQRGTATVSTNFDAGTFSISASTANTSLTGSGVVNTSDGRLASSTLTFSVDGGGSYGATTHGLLHGTNSTSVSGVFYTNDVNPDYAGAYLGSR